MKILLPKGSPVAFYHWLDGITDAIDAITEQDCLLEGRQYDCKGTPWREGRYDKFIKYDDIQVTLYFRERDCVVIEP